MKKLLVTLALCASASLSSAEYMPWFGNAFEILFDAEFGYENYDKFDKGPNNRSVHGHVFNFGLATTLLEPLNLSLDFSFADTADSSLGWQALEGMARYGILNDIAGDPISLTAGGALRYVSSDAIHDRMSVYQGDIELEGHIAAGKEMSLEDIWLHRMWSMLALQISNRGSPLLKTSFHFEKNFENLHQVGVFLRYIRSFGGDATFDGSFPGYGRLSSKMFDLGFDYRYNLEIYGMIYTNFTYRFHGSSAPKDGFAFKIGYEVPFSL